MRKLSSRWLWFLVASSLAAVILLPPALYTWHLARQRSLQEQIRKLPGVYLDDRSQHWLFEWLPERLAYSLPATRMRLEVNGLESIDALIPLACETNDIEHIELWSGYDFQPHHWQLVIAQPHLSSLRLSSMPVTDKQLGALSNHRNLREIHIADAPLTDASLSLFDRLPALERLTLNRTAINIDAIEAFAKAHPNIRIGWIAPPSFAQQELQARLKEQGIFASEVYHDDRIARVPEWELAFGPDILLAPATCKDLNSLCGPIVAVSTITPISPEAMDAIHHFSELRTVILDEPALRLQSAQAPTAVTVEEIDALARLPNIQKIRYPDEFISAEERQALYERWGSKVPEPPRKIPPCY